MSMMWIVLVTDIAPASHVIRDRETEETDTLWMESDFEFAPRNLWTSMDLKFSIDFDRYMIG